MLTTFHHTASSTQTDTRKGSKTHFLMTSRKAFPMLPFWMRPASCLCQYLKQYSEGATRYNVLGCLPEALCGLQVRVQEGVHKSLHGVVNMSPSRQLQLERIQIIKVQNFKFRECIKPQTSKLPTCSCFSSLLLLALCSQVSSAAGVVMTGVCFVSVNGLFTFSI